MFNNSVLSKSAHVAFRILCLLPGSNQRSPSNLARVAVMKLLARKVGSGCMIMPGCLINMPQNLILGNSAGIGYRSIISCHDNVVIGDRVMMGADVIIYTSNHIWSAKKRTYAGQGLERAPVSIGSDTWIGSRAIVLPGVKIGIGVTVAAAAVVTRDIPDFAVVAGVPARVIKFKNVDHE